jgi:protein-disulfide isomerase
MLRKSTLAIATLAILVGGIFLWQQQNQPPEVTAAAKAKVGQTAVVKTAATPKPAAKTPANIKDTQATSKPAVTIREMTEGKADAPVTIVEYASFTCPHCARFHTDVYGKIVKNYVDNGKVRFVMRDIYFDRLGLWASMLARCDGGKKFFGISDLVYNTQREWTKGKTNIDIANNLKKIGRIAGLDDATMDTCLQDSAKAQALVEEYQKNSAADNVEGTPTFFINNKKYPNMAYADFAKAIDAALAAN